MVTLRFGLCMLLFHLGKILNMLTLSFKRFKLFKSNIIVICDLVFGVLFHFLCPPLVTENHQY